MSLYPSVPFKTCLAAPLAYGVLKPDRYEGHDAVCIIRIMDVDDRGNVAMAGLERISPRQDREFSRTKLADGDLVISVVGTLGRTFQVGEVIAGCNLSRALARVQLKRSVCVRYVQLWMSSHQFWNQADAIATGTAQRVLNLSALRVFQIPLPDFDRQKIIADFLDRRVAAIDSFIEKKQRLIALLEEKRVAIVHRAVTYGVNSLVPMRDSGIAVLGSIPAHWKTVRNKEVMREVADLS